MIESDSRRSENEVDAVPGGLPIFFGGVLSAILGSILGAGVGVLLNYVNRGGWPAGGFVELQLFARSVVIGTLGGAVAGIGGFCLGFAFSGERNAMLGVIQGPPKRGYSEKARTGHRRLDKNRSPPNENGDRSAQEPKRGTGTWGEINSTSGPYLSFSLLTLPRRHARMVN
jgi:hypothetical protein